METLTVDQFMERIGCVADDLPYKLCYSAHAGTSHVPDKRADSERADYIAGMRARCGELISKCKTDAQLAAAVEGMKAFREGYLKRKRHHLSTRSNCVSTMIAGPAKFNTRRAEKANRSEHNRLDELIGYTNKAYAAILNKIGGMIEADAVEAAGGPVAVLEKRIATERGVLETMEAVNKIVANKKTDQAAKLAALVQVRGINQARAEELLRPNCDGLPGFTGYQVRQLKKKIAGLETDLRRMTQPTEYLEYRGARVEEDIDDDRLRIHFDDKPSEDMAMRLKRRGFKWSPTNKAWQRQLTDNAIEAAKGILWPLAFKRSADAEPEGAGVIPSDGSGDGFTDPRDEDAAAMNVVEIKW